MGHCGIKYEMHGFANGSVLRDLTLFQMKARYRGTFAGFIWVVLNPVILLAVQGVIFKHILRVQMDSYPSFLLGGLLPWSFFSMSIQMGVPALSSARQLLLSFKLEPAWVVLSVVLDNWVNFIAACALSVVGVGLLVDPSILSLRLLVFPLAALLLLAGVAGLVFFLAIFNVFYRDVRFVCMFGLNLLLFVTPVFYPVELLPESQRWLMAFNPVRILIEPVRYCVLPGGLSGAWNVFAPAGLLALVLIGASGLYWRMRRNEFYLYV